MTPFDWLLVALVVVAGLVCCAVLLGLADPLLRPPQKEGEE
jgi:hypothetical protein